MKLDVFCPDTGHSNPGNVNTLFGYALTDIVEVWKGVDLDTSATLQFHVIHSYTGLSGAPTAYTTAPNQSYYIDTAAHLTYSKSGQPGLADGTWAAQN